MRIRFPLHYTLCWLAISLAATLCRFNPAVAQPPFAEITTWQADDPASSATQQKQGKDSSDEDSGASGEVEKAGQEAKEGEKADEEDSSAGDDKNNDVEKRLKELEEQVEKQLASEREAEAAAKEEPTISVGGRIHADTWNFMRNAPGIGFLENPDPASDSYGDDPEDRFVFRRIRLELEGDIPDNMLWRIQVDFNNPASPEYKDVYFGWQDLPGNHSLLLGNQKRPLGLDPLDSSRYTVFMERPMVTDAFNEDARRVGVALYGYTDDEAVNWNYGIFSLENTSTDGRFIGDSLQLGGYGRLAATPWFDDTSDGRDYFHWALAGAVAHPDGDNFPGDTNDNEAQFRSRPSARTNSRWLDTEPIGGADWFEILAVENVLNLGRFQVTSEYMVNFLQRDQTSPDTGPDVFFHGGYVYGSYFLTGEHMPWDRTSGTLERVRPFENFFLVDCLGGGTERGWGAWQIAARYDYLDLTDQDIRGGVGQSYTMGLNWYWNAYSKVQTNVSYGDISHHRLVAGYDGGDYWITGMRFMCDF